jgi:Zn-finger nucleic acid-binding protein
VTCPTCKDTLFTCEIQDIELDFCVHDHGCWLDAGEIGALLQSQAPLRTTPVRAAGGAKRCPRCRARMNPHHPVEGLQLDLCPHGHGIWFDEGELGTLIAKLRTHHAPGAPTHLNHILNRLATKLGGIPCRTR